MTQYYVVGGLYADTHFTHLATGQREVRQGPFDSYEAARKAWQSLAWESVDDATAKYRIETLRQKKAASEAPLAYRLLTGPDDRQFCERVSQALKEGYRLHGTPSLTTNSAGQVIVGQALVLATD